jgi:hypothetical protein
MPANHARGAESSQAEAQAQGQASGVSPYGVIPDALTSHLLSLQSKDAFCQQGTWKSSPNGQIEEKPFRGRWSADRIGLARHNGAVYIPDDLATKMLGVCHTLRRTAALKRTE